MQLKGPSRVIASANAHEQGSCAAVRTREVPQARHSPTKGCHGVGSTPPQQVQIRLVRIGTEVEAAKAAVKTLLQRRGTIGHREEYGGAPALRQQTAGEQ